MSYKRIQLRPKESSIEEHTAPLEDQDLLAAAERAAGSKRPWPSWMMERAVSSTAGILENQSFEDIGLGLAMPTNTAKTRYYRALKSLAARLRPFATEQ